MVCVESMGTGQSGLWFVLCLVERERRERRRGPSLIANAGVVGARVLCVREMAFLGGLRRRLGMVHKGE